MCKEPHVCCRDAKLEHSYSSGHNRLQKCFFFHSYQQASTEILCVPSPASLTWKGCNYQSFSHSCSTLTSMPPAPNQRAWLQVCTVNPPQPHPQKDRRRDASELIPLLLPYYAMRPWCWDLKSSYTLPHCWLSACLLINAVDSGTASVSVSSIASKNFHPYSRSRQESQVQLVN